MTMMVMLMKIELNLGKPEHSSGDSSKSKHWNSGYLSITPLSEHTHVGHVQRKKTQMSNAQSEEREERNEERRGEREEGVKLIETPGVSKDPRGREQPEGRLRHGGELTERLGEGKDPAWGHG